MKHFLNFICLAFALATPLLPSTITSIPTRGALAADDFVTWADSIPNDLLNPTSPYNRTSNLGLGVTANLSNSGDFAVYQQNGPAYTANFTQDEYVLDTNFANASMLIRFAAAISGVGFQIAHLNTGDFTGTVNFYDAADLLLGSISAPGQSNSNNDGSALFLGGKSSQRNIMSITISVSNEANSTAFAINQLSILTEGTAENPVPEPSTLVLAGGALLLCAYKRSR